MLLGPGHLRSSAEVPRLLVLPGYSLRHGVRVSDSAFSD